MAGLKDAIIDIVSAFKPIQVKVAKVEQKFSINGKEITTDKYVENSGKFSFTARPDISKDDESQLDKKLFEKTDGFVNVELLTQETITTKLFFSKGTLMRKYKNFLFEKDLSAVLLAYTVCFLEDNNKREDSGKEKEKLVKMYKDRGRTIYNYVRSGLFETEILKELNMIIKENSDPLEISKKFREHFESIMLLHPTRIYVSIGWSVDDLISEVSTRFQNLAKAQNKELYIYSRSSNMNTVDKLKEVDSIKETFEIKDDVYTFGTEKAKTTILRIKKKELSAP